MRLAIEIDNASGIAVVGIAAGAPIDKVLASIWKTDAGRVEQ